MFFYLRGYALGAPDDQCDVLRYLRRQPRLRPGREQGPGYTGINAAFILDVLARQDEESAARAGMESGRPLSVATRPGLIREEIIRSVPPLLDDPENAWLREEWWFYATVGEAYFGLGEYDPLNYGRRSNGWSIVRRRRAWSGVPAAPRQPRSTSPSGSSKARRGSSRGLPCFRASPG